MYGVDRIAFFLARPHMSDFRVTGHVNTVSIHLLLMTYLRHFTTFIPETPLYILIVGLLARLHLLTVVIVTSTKTFDCGRCSNVQCCISTFLGGLQD